MAAKSTRYTILKAFFISSSYVNAFTVLTCFLGVTIDPAIIGLFIGVAVFVATAACYLVYNLLIELIILKTSIRSFDAQIQSALTKLRTDRNTKPQVVDSDASND